MVVIEIKNNNVCELHGPQPELNKLYNKMNKRHPEAFFLRRHMPRGWDGKVPFIKKNGTFTAGLLEHIGELCDTEGIEWDIMDNRALKIKTRKVTSMGDWELRDYQLDSIKALVKNKVKDVPWIRGTIKVATNGGKTSISGFTYLCLRKEPTVYLMNSAELYRDAIQDIPKIIGEPVGYIRGNDIKFANFMVCMAPSLKNRLKDNFEVKQWMNNCKVLIVDECDIVANKTNKEVITSLYNTIARVGLSGTVNASKLKKDEIKNLTIEGFFGKQLYTISNKDLIDKGVSSKVQVTIVKGNTDEMAPGFTWQDEYEYGIVQNLKRNKRVVKRAIYHYKNNRKNQLVVAQRHAHIKKLYRLFLSAQKAGHFKDAKIDWVHHSRKDRAEVVDQFKEGKIDILIGSMILKRGKNFPLMKFMINAGGGKSPENILQLLGRAFRGAEYYEDMFDEGPRLKSHSRKRIAYYKNEKIEVLNPFKLR